MIIRQAQNDDLKGLAVLFDAYRVFYKQKSDVIQAENFLKLRMQNADSVIFVAELKNQLLGFTQLYPLFSSVSMQRTYVLNDLYVDADSRGKGVGEKLLSAAKSFASENDCKGLTLETDVDNPAQSLYTRLGWKKDVEVFHYTWKNPKYQDN